MKQKRFKPEIRKVKILKVALKLAAVKGYAHVTWNEVAAKAGVTGPAVQYHFGPVALLRAAVMRYAIEHRHPRVVAQGLAARNSFALRVDSELKQLARDAM
jgi:AcrR family transcriptional regulator